jgi:hypothetical protein
LTITNSRRIVSRPERHVQEDDAEAAYVLGLHTVLATLQSINLVCAGMMVGGMAIEQVVVLPLVRELGPADGPRAMRIGTPRALRIQPPLGVLATSSGIVVLVAAWHWNALADWRLALTFAGVVLFIAGASVALALYLPTDRDLRALDSGTVDDGEFVRLVRRITRLNGARLVLHFTGFLCFIEAALVGQ